MKHQHAKEIITRSQEVKLISAPSISCRDVVPPSVAAAGRQSRGLGANCFAPEKWRAGLMKRCVTVCMCACVAMMVVSECEAAATTGGVQPNSKSSC